MLDENAPDSARDFLETQRLPVRKVGFDWGRKGMSDEEIVTRLHRARRVTYVTRDIGLYRRDLCHAAYCLVLVAAGADRLAGYVDRFLRQPFFQTHAQRMGKVICLQPTRIAYWERGAAGEERVRWV